MYVSAIIAVVLCTGLSLWLSQTKKKTPCIPALPAIPSFLRFILSALPLPDLMSHVLKNPGKALVGLFKIYGPVFTMDLGGFTFITVNGYAAIKEVLATRGSDYAGRYNEPKQLFVNPHEYGILEGKYTPEWKIQRAASISILKAFGFGKRSFENRILEEIESMLRITGQQAGEVFNISKHISVSVANIICSMVFGERYAYDDKRLQFLLDANTEVLKSLTDRPFGAFNPSYQWLPPIKRSRNKYAKAYKKLTGFCHDQILEHQKTHEQDNPRDFVDAYIDKMNNESADPSFNTEQLTCLLYELFIAGSETTADTLQWFLVYMINNPDMQERMRKEIDSVVEEGHLPSLHDRERLPYCEAVMREVQRISPVLPIGPFHVARCDTQLMGHAVAKGMPVAINYYSVLMDPELFPDPESFKPERFLGPDGQLLKNEHMIQFGAGPRTCMGQQLAKQELFLFSTSLIQRFVLSAPPGVAKLCDEGVWTTTFKPPPFKICATARV